MDLNIQKMTNHPPSPGNQPLRKARFVNMLSSIWRKGLSESNVKAGFEAIGIYPINSSKYKTEQLDPVKLRKFNKWEENGFPVDDIGSPILIHDEAADNIEPAIEPLISSSKPKKSKQPSSSTPRKVKPSSSTPRKSSHHHRHPEKSSHHHRHPEKSSYHHQHPENSSHHHRHPEKSSHHHRHPENYHHRHPENRLIRE